MNESELKRPEMKYDATPLTEADKYDFLPYIDRAASVLPSEQGTWKTDVRAVAFLKAIKDGEDLYGTDWSGINLKGADLSGANLSGVNLSKANLMNANLSDALLEWTDLSYAYLENANFSNAFMQNTQMKGVFYKNCNMDGADLDEETKNYLTAVEWFLEQLEAGKIKLDSIPPDQLSFLDLRTIDLSQVEIPEDIDLSSIVLTGVNLSGVYIPKGHFLNMALMAKQKARAKLIIQRTQRTLDLLFQKIRTERKEKVLAFSKQEKAKKQVVREEALKNGRPPLKTEVKEIKTTDKKETTEAIIQSRHPSAKKTTTRRLSSQKRKVKTQKTNLKKRA
ncbi:MAG: pentapeptide repeat-containing protein [Alphaproteobacteria bacterium]|nr:pentapeptide repeat-containing protein [Alphaproteobacteria bacterium]